MSRPDCGVQDVRVGTGPIPGRFMGVEMPALESDRRLAPLDAYCRGNDLVVVYEELPSWPVRVDAMWRATSPPVGDQVLSAIDLIVSVRTGLLDSWPELAVRSVVPEAAVLRWNSDLARCETVETQTGSPRVFRAAAGFGCLLLRPAGAAASYAEMVHPIDFRKTELRRVESPQAEVTWRHLLFAESLEKGVILRARVRGLIVPREGDAETVPGCYNAFASAGPPLSN